MWEVRAAPGRADELLAWTLDAVGALDAGVYRSIGQSADVVVAIVALPGGWRPGEPVLPTPPADLVARPAQGWAFAQVR
jgi:hypothetical protein